MGIGQLRAGIPRGVRKYSLDLLHRIKWRYITLKCLGYQNQTQIFDTLASGFSMTAGQIHALLRNNGVLK
jgi:hypothetical protein